MTHLQVQHQRGEAGVAAVIHNRTFWGCEIVDEYIDIGKKRLDESVEGTVKYRPFSKPIYDPRQSNLSKIPTEWTTQRNSEEIE